MVKTLTDSTHGKSIMVLFTLWVLGNRFVFLSFIFLHYTPTYIILVLEVLEFFFFFSLKKKYLNFFLGSWIFLNILSNMTEREKLWGLQVIMINGQFPGPQINCVTNDNLIISVYNALNEPFLLSW